jgi:hypothetical protein
MAFVGGAKLKAPEIDRTERRLMFPSMVKREAATHPDLLSSVIM